MKTYDEIIEHYQRDPKLYRLILKTEHRIEPDLNTDIYRSLLSSIVSQQLHTKVAAIIWNRFTDTFADRYPDPVALLDKSHEALRKAGLSNNKVKYMKNVAEYTLQNDISYENLSQLTDEEIIETLTRIKGVGKWTVQMILMFPMDRPNIFPVDDLGIQKAIKFLYRLDSEKKELKKSMLEISENWHPYRTLACKYLWKMAD